MRSSNRFTKTLTLIVVAVLFSQFWVVFLIVLPFLAVLVYLIASLIVDVLYAVLDPRIRYD